MSSTTSNQPSKCKVLSHEDKLVQYFCLDEHCFNKRLFCQACAKLDHKKHRIGRIDRLIEPLSLLNINSFHEDSSQIYSELKKKIDDFYEVILFFLSRLSVTLENLFNRLFSNQKVLLFSKLSPSYQLFPIKKLKKWKVCFSHKTPMKMM